MFKVFFHRIAVTIVTFGYLFCGLFSGSGFDSILHYRSAVKNIPVYSNTIKEAVPQTEMYRFIEEHFESELPAGKTVKKAIVIGYDGCRADVLQHLDNEHDSAIQALLAEKDGNAFLSYCGGVNYPLINTQATSTAPGWCSMLTGAWADKHGVTDNDVVKNPEYRTLLTTLVEDGIIDESSFYVSWGGHFSGDNATYIEEKTYCEKNNLKVNFLRAGDDDGTKANTLNDLKKADCADFIFSIFEYTDHVGHDVTFSPYNKDYTQAFYDAEATGLEVINTIKARPTYDTEDWLILITSDHGGSTFGHGGMTIMERMTFVVSNKDIL